MFSCLIDRQYLFKLYLLISQELNLFLLTVGCTCIWFLKVVFFPFWSDLHWIDTVCNKPILRGWRALWEISNGVIPREAHWWIATSCVCYCQWVLLFHVEEGRKPVCIHKVQIIITSFFYWCTKSNYTIHV